jgi:5-carboxymethyl-2-hydroxymuconate isomerase
MPHIVVEYSGNLDGRLDVTGLVNAVHAAAFETGVFELAAIRTRAERRDVYRIADGNPENAFIAISARIAPRPDEVRHSVGQAIFDATVAFTAQIFARSPLAISVEVLNIDNTAAFRKNNLHERLGSRKKAAVS